METTQKTHSEAISSRLKTLFFIFFLSGFAGLIYESIWTHYLKLFLGHAAYAQTLVLTIFMLGMSIGSWVAGRLTGYTRRFFFIYACVELVLGAFAFSFHWFSQAVMAFFFDSIVPGAPSAAFVNGIKWSLAALLIVPQSILIGMTFPLIANGLLDMNRKASGRMISMLYFTNSIGASLGVLASGFVLIGLVGLPGTLTISGTVNVIIAVSILYIFRNQLGGVPSGALPGRRANRAQKYNKRKLLLFCVAAFTGLASFVYEITWIRLLSLVLGSATHSFELMLSAFILGLALGGYIIRKRIDSFENPIGVLAIIQILMGVAALLSLALYNYSFEFIQIAYLSLAKLPPGYYLYTLAGHLVCLLIMLPATIFAGMTLPIIINLLVKEEGDQSVGHAYAINTIGSIAGILLAVHVLFPFFGAKNSLVFGAFIDVALGLILFGFTKTYTSKVNYVAMCLLSMVVFASLFQADLNLNKLVSGVFRHGNIDYDKEIWFFKDGKTATVSVEFKNDQISLSTNGKPDASMRKDDTKSQDEATQTLVGAIPMAILDDIHSVAVIGFGSGMSSHAILASQAVEVVDTIEIEPSMVEGARFFYDKVYRAFDDDRSNIVYEDAKTYFATSAKSYDMIVAEPSNPWVSGVSSLFTTEFYSNVKRYLTADGYFAQWVQTYELSPSLLATIANALGEKFRYYEIYAMDDSDLLFIASDIPIPDPSMPDESEAELLAELSSFGIHNKQDVAIHRVASKEEIASLFLEFNQNVNSDYYPYVDQGAVKARYLLQNASGIADLKYGLLPIEETFYGIPPVEVAEGNEHISWSVERYDVLKFYDRLIAGKPNTFELDFIELYFLTDKECIGSVKSLFWGSFPSLFNLIAANLSSDKLAAAWGKIKEHQCLKAVEAHPENGDYRMAYLLFEARAKLDFPKVKDLAINIWSKEPENGAFKLYSDKFLLLTWLWADVLSGQYSDLPFEESDIIYHDENKNWLAKFLLMKHREGRQ